MKNTFILSLEQEDVFKKLKNEQAGKLIKAIFEYQRTGEEPKLPAILDIAFTPIKQSIDKNNFKYEAVCEKNRGNIEKRWNTKNTTGKSGIKKIPSDTKNTDNEELIYHNHIHNKYGIYKRILLSIEEYNKLVEEYTKEFIDNQINRLDEYVESNNNKNKYSNWNLVLRKSIREKWFDKDKTPSWFNKEANKEEMTKEELAELEESLKEFR